MTAVNSDQVNDSSIDGEADIVERAIRYNTQRYLNLLSLSQNDLTGPLGITKGAVSQLLTGNSKLKFRQVYILARTFGVTVEELMDPTYMLESEELSRQLMKNRRKTKAEYLTGHNGPSDISHRELSAPVGARYLRKPDENEDRPHGAIGPRAFVMPLMDVDQMNLGPRFSARTRFKLPHLDSNQDKGFQRPVCCHYTMGERQKHTFSAKCSLCHIIRTPHTTGCRATALRTFWRILIWDGSAANGVETIFKKFFAKNWHHKAQSTIIRTHTNKHDQYLSEKVGAVHFY